MGMIPIDLLMNLRYIKWAFEWHYRTQLRTMMPIFPHQPNGLPQQAFRPLRAAINPLTLISPTDLVIRYDPH